MNQRTLGFILSLSVAALTSATTQCANTVGDTKSGAADGPAAADSARPSPAKLDGQDEPAAPIRVAIDGLPTYGNPNALVTLVAFTDYECPYCAKAQDTLATLTTEYGDRMRIVVASRPLPFHESATPAARAFLAAVEQGKGEAMHARLFANKTNDLGEDGLRSAARDVGLDLTAFDQARSGPSTDLALGKSEKLATALNVTGTPTFFINGRRIMGARPIETFRATIDEELGKAEALVATGVPPAKVYATLSAAAPEYVIPKDDAWLSDEVVDVGVEEAPLRGSSKAPVTIVVFSDFECRFCARAATTLAKLQANNPDTVRVVYRQLPLPMHSHARLAAKASIAADKQGRFWDYHDALFAHRDALERADLEQYAVTLGLDRTRFLSDLDSPEVEAAVAADEARARALGANATPTSFVNGRRVRGAQPMTAWVSATQRSLKDLGLPVDKLVLGAAR